MTAAKSTGNTTLAPAVILLSDEIYETRAGQWGCLPIFTGDGDAAGWSLGSSPYEVTAVTAARGHRSLHIHYSPGGHFNGLTHAFGSAQPGYIGFHVRMAQTNSSTGNFIVRDIQGMEVIWFHAASQGRLYANDNTSVPYATHTWYHVVFRNLDYAFHRFDYYVNGTLIQRDVPFRSYNDNIAVLDLYNHDYGVEAWCDAIALGPGSPAEWRPMQDMEIRSTTFMNF